MTDIAGTLWRADAADRADGHLRHRGSLDADGPIAGAALTVERHVDAERAQEGLCAAQSAGQSARIPWPAGGPAVNRGPSALSTELQQGRGGPRPGSALEHHFANPS